MSPFCIVQVEFKKNSIEKDHFTSIDGSKNAEECKEQLQIFSQACRIKGLSKLFE